MMLMRIEMQSRLLRILLFRASTSTCGIPKVITLSLRNVTAAIARQLLAVSSSAAIWMECPDFDNPKIRASDLQEIEARYPTLGYFRLLVATSVFGMRRLLWPT